MTADRRGRAPATGRSLIECKTYRWRGHSKSDRNRYRTKDEIEDVAQARSDPAFEAELVGARPLRRRGARGDREGGRAARSTAALEFAKASPDPDPSQLTRDVYAD